MGQTVSAGRDNNELVDNLVETDYIRNTEIQRIFRAVDRADYFLTEQKQDAYRDSAWRAGNLHLSAPCVYSGVMESLNLRPGLSFLNLGSGCGYLSTMAGLILGSYGVNHGIEIYKDVVDYAYDRLDNFIKHCDAIDEYDFCEPTFVTGNCLKIDSVQLYDRVYCGAACPVMYEIYMKHLIKVGGVLVMPLDNKLLQITRTTSSTWETVTVLAALFTPLIPPSDTEPTNFVQLPEFSPPSLQVLCRSRIRTILKSRIDEEHPILQEKKIERCRNRNRRRIRRIVIPNINESDSNDSGNDSDRVDMEFRSPNARIILGRCTRTYASALVSGFLHARPEIQAVVAEPSNWNTVSETSAASDNKTEKMGTAENTERKQTKKEGNDENSFTSNSSASSDKDTEIICSAALIDEREIEANLTSPPPPPDESLASKKPCLTKRGHSGSNPGTSNSFTSNSSASSDKDTEIICDAALIDEHEIEANLTSPPNETLASKKPCLTKRRHSGSNPGTSKSKKLVKLSPKKRLQPSDLALHVSAICNRLPLTCQFAVKKKAAAANKTPENDTVNYRSLMAKKILSLPLSKHVQMYVNYGRNNM